MLRQFFNFLVRCCFIVVRMSCQLIIQILINNFPFKKFKTQTKHDFDFVLCSTCIFSIKKITLGLFFSYTTVTTYLFYQEKLFFGVKEKLNIDKFEYFYKKIISRMRYVTSLFWIKKTTHKLIRNKLKKDIQNKLYKIYCFVQINNFVIIII